MASFDFQKVWTLLDIILKVAQTGSSELHNIVSASHDELKQIHDALGEEKAAAVAAMAPVPAEAPAEVKPSAIPSSTFFNKDANKDTSSNG